MNLEQPTTVDWETFAIEGRPDDPPIPVGVSIKRWGKAPKYWAWGHVNGGNNCTKAEATAALQVVWKGPLLFHNAKFDLSVAHERHGLPIPTWEHIHDTQFLLYLDDPRARTFALKPSSERLLNLPPDERDAVNDWLITHQPVPGKRITPKTAGAYIALAPGQIVGPYANGDVVRTENLFKYGLAKIKERGMLAAYHRERELLPILMENERRGVPVALDRLRKDVAAYHKQRKQLDAWLHKALKVSDINLDSADELGEALIRSGKADEALLGRTDKGKVATNQFALAAGIKDKQLYAVLVYRSQLSTCLGTFMEPWLRVAERTGGVIHTNWNQVRSDKGGTTTGRMSSSPNFQNIPNEFDQLFFDAALKASAVDPKEFAANKRLPKVPFQLLDLPRVRGYVVPPKGEVLLDRDYSQQELRILGHFEDAELKQAYKDDPWMDAHDTAQTRLADFGLHYERKPVKNTNFGIIYGQGASSLAFKNGLSIEDSKALMKSIKNTVFPGLKDLFDDLRDRAKNDLPVRTWGGREYFCEPPKYSEKYGRWMTFDYKLLNLIVQGSAADCCKQAIINWEKIRHEDDRFLLSVHDQQTISAPKKRRDDAMRRLKVALEDMTFDVPMLSEGKWSDSNWDDLRPYDKRGKPMIQGISLTA